MPVLQFKGKTAVENYQWTIPHHVLEFDKKLSVLDKGQLPSLDGIPELSRHCWIKWTFQKGGVDRG